MSYARGSAAMQKSSFPTEIPTGHDKKLAAGVDAQTRPTNLPLPLAPTAHIAGRRQRAAPLNGQRFVRRKPEQVSSVLAWSLKIE